mgnify:CR=1 FL=1
MMKKILFAILLLSLHAFVFAAPISLNSPASTKMLQDALTLKTEELLSNFTVQKTQTYCGVASAVTVLNALNAIAPMAKVPVDPIYKPYRYFTQADFFDKTAQAIYPAEKVLKKGIPLAKLVALISSKGVGVQYVHASNDGLEQFVGHLQNFQTDKHSFIIVNYFRKTLGQVGGGHFSVIGAYDKKESKVLILDVAKYKYQPVWVKVQTLFKAMLTQDSDSGLTRGYIVIKPKQA